jgi:hypothetical protein
VSAAPADRGCGARILCDSKRAAAAATPENAGRNALALQPRLQAHRRDGKPSAERAMTTAERAMTTAGRATTTAGRATTTAERATTTAERAGSIDRFAPQDVAQTDGTRPL